MRRTIVRSQRMVARAALRLRVSGERAVVLCYHSVHPHKRYVSITPDLFRKHMEVIASFGDVVTFGEIVETVLQDGARLGRRPLIAVTFDDGYLDNYVYALPILREFQVPATFFVTAGLILRDDRVIERFLRGLRWQRTWADIEPMTADHLRDVAATGMEVGAHGYDHVNLVRLPEQELLRDLMLARNHLSEIVAADIRVLAYPFGRPGAHVTGEVAAAARGAGYRYAATTTCRGVKRTDSPYLIPRLVIGATDPAWLRFKLAGGWDLAGRWNEACPVWLQHVLSPRQFRV